MVSRTHPRLLGALGALVLGLGSALVHPGTAAAGAVDYFDQAFRGHYVPDDLVVVPPGRYGQPNAVCLTDEYPFSDVLAGCPTSTFPREGKLRLTDFARNQVGGVFLTKTVPGDRLLVSTFRSYQHGTANTPADGLAFVLAAVDPAKQQPPAALGSAGGALGYSSTKGTAGLPHGYLGFGFDVYGGFSRTGNQGTGCPDQPYVSADAPVPGQVVVRGPGHKSVGYCALASTATSPQSAPVPLHARSLQASEVPVEAAINPTGSAITTEAGTAVAARSYALTFTPVGVSPRTLRGPLPKVQAGLYPASWLDADGYPKRLAYGVVGTTGGSRDFHEISDMRAYRTSRPAQLSVSQTAYLDADPAVGDPVSYVHRIGTGLGFSDLVHAEVRARVTLPDGVRPVGGSGIGWDCTPTGQQLDCRQNTDYANARSALASKLVVQGQVTRSGVTRATVATGTRVEVSAAGAAPVTSAETALAGVPPGPGDLTVTPSRGPAGSRIELNGAQLDQVHLVRIGTVDELTSGAAEVLVPCVAGYDDRSCFTVGPRYRYLGVQLPAHRTGRVQVQMIGLGRTASAPFTYDSTPAAPSVSASFWQGVMQVMWWNQGDGSSPVTGWTVTPYRDGVRQTPLEVAGRTFKITVPNVQAGATYVFTVAGRNASGTGPVGTSGEVVVPG